jgi:Uncharacterized conserved protein
MQGIFNDVEGLRIALEMEKRGAELYRYATRITNDARTNQLLLSLERDELNHQAEFAALLGEKTALPDDESQAVISSQAADVVFSGGLISMVMECGLDNPAAIIRHAIGEEMSSIAFYEKIAAQTQNEQVRSACLAIADQEREHKQTLEEMLSEEVQ